MESLIKFLEDKITDKMSVEEIVDVFKPKDKPKVYSIHQINKSYIEFYPP